MFVLIKALWGFVYICRCHRCYVLERVAREVNLDDSAILKRNTGVFSRIFVSQARVRGNSCRIYVIEFRRSPGN